MVYADKLFVANAGDSRCVLCRGQETVALTDDHKPTNPDEERRIKAAGGFVSDGRINGGLNLSRAIGDMNYKTVGCCACRLPWPLGCFKPACTPRCCHSTSHTLCSWATLCSQQTPRSRHAPCLRLCRSTARAPCSRHTLLMASSVRATRFVLLPVDLTNVTTSRIVDRNH